MNFRGLWRYLRTASMQAPCPTPSPSKPARLALCSRARSCVSFFPPDAPLLPRNVPPKRRNRARNAPETRIRSFPKGLSLHALSVSAHFRPAPKAKPPARSSSPRSGLRQHRRLRRAPRRQGDASSASLNRQRIQSRGSSPGIRSRSESFGSAKARVRMQNLRTAGSSSSGDFERIRWRMPSGTGIRTAPRVPGQRQPLRARSASFAGRGRSGCRRDRAKPFLDPRA